jgi:type I restriction enzyme S subunit
MAPETLPATWRLVTLEELVGDAAPIVYGIIQAGPEVAGGVPYIRPTELVDDQIDLGNLRRTSIAIAQRYERSVLRAGDIVLAIVGTIGKLAIVPPELEGANITQSSARVRPPPGMPSEFLAAALKSPQLREQFKAMEFGVAVRRLNLSHVRDLKIPLPPYNEQRRIVAKLEALQTRSRRAREALDAVPPLLEKLRQSILAAAFRGDLTKDWRAKHKDVEPASELLKRIRAERKKKWEEAELAKMKAKGKTPTDDKWKAKYKEPEPVNTSGLPELPRGWCWASPDELCSPIPNALTIGPFGSDLKVDDYREDGVPLVFVRDIRAESFGGEKTKFVDVEKAAALARHYVHPGDLLMTKMGDPPGDTAVYPPGRPSAVITADCIKLTPLASITSGLFLKYCFRAEVVREQLLEQTAGVAQQKLSLERFRTVRIPLPPREEQVELAGRIDALSRGAMHQTAKLKQLGGRLTVVERALLAKAFRGELVPQDPNDEPADVLLARNGAGTSDARAPEPVAKKRAVKRDTADDDVARVPSARTRAPQRTGGR